MQTNDFSVSFKRNGETQQVKVVIDPSTDDVDTYVCYIGNDRITQIRKDGQVWKQLWGELNEEEVSELGRQVEEELTH